MATSKHPKEIHYFLLRLNIKSCYIRSGINLPMSAVYQIFRKILPKSEFIAGCTAVGVDDRGFPGNLR